MEVAPDAPQEAVTAAYRRLVFEYHPDRNRSADAAAKTAEINEAYRVLGAAKERAKYDLARLMRAQPLQDVPRVIIGTSKLAIYELQDPKPRHGQVCWADGIWTPVSSRFPICRTHGCLVLLQIDPSTRQQIYQHGQDGPAIRIDPKQGEFTLLAQWLEECHQRDRVAKR